MQKPIISADSHITEPPNTYVDRIDHKYKDTAPHMVHDEKLGDVFHRQGLPASDQRRAGRSGGQGRERAEDDWREVRRDASRADGIPTRAWPTRIATASPPKSSTPRSG